MTTSHPGFGAFQAMPVNEGIRREPPPEPCDKDDLALLNAPAHAIDVPPAEREVPERSPQFANGIREGDLSATIKILVVDDDTMKRIGLRLALGTQKTYVVVGEADSGMKAREQVEDLEPDLVLMDVHLPDASGIEISRRILDSHPRTRILMISSDVSRTVIDKALEIGVCGYLSKASSLEEVLKAIDSVLAGKLYLSAEASREILKDYRSGLLKKVRGDKSSITEHEKALLRLISQGLRNKEIASELQVSGKSVEAYRSRLMKKLNCSSPAELVLYAIREGIAKA